MITKTNIELLTEKYQECLKEEKEIKDRKVELSETLCSELKKIPEQSVLHNRFKYTLVQGTQVKWDDDGLETYLKSNNLWSQCSKEVVDKDKLISFFNDDDDNSKEVSEKISKFAEVVNKKPYVKVSKLKEA